MSKIDIEQLAEQSAKESGLWNYDEYDKEQAHWNKCLIEIYLEGYQKATEAQKWVDASERLPEKDGYYIVGCGGNHQDITWFHVTPNHKGEFNKFIIDDVLIWTELLPLPEAP